MTRTPDEIKKGLECCKCGISWATTCAKGCPYKNVIVPGGRCEMELLKDALALVQQLEAKGKLVEQYRWERDVAIDQLKQLGIWFGEKVNGKGNAELLKKIEQLQAELDAAVEDMRQASIYLCCACKKYHHAVRGVSNHYCEEIGERADFTGAMSCGMFEWRGVQKEDDDA